uniref:leucine-rich repeat-containing protein 56 isoform X2 n=1 Tax=Doryrhamphus excisus TaxID=161450 RepID=UPI0025AE3E10|nr:leucine-rich repeat-containing protein 56 isoform X2 [Doryrhamphus excisus]
MHGAASLDQEMCKVSDFYLRKPHLELLCGTKDLTQVTSLEICVNTQETSLCNFGISLPRLVLLNMNNSVIMSVRDLGTTLTQLQVLWMSCCCLQDLDGISSLASLRELYLAFNKVSDLSQVGMLENLQVLDLEGNDVDDLVQIQYLGLCGKLQTLTLEGNPVCVRPNPMATQTDYNYWESVRELVPQLHYLDNARVEHGRPGFSDTMWEDWSILRNCIRDYYPAATEEKDAENGARPYSRLSSARRPTSSIRSLSSASTTTSRPLTATSSGSPVSTPGSADSDFAEVEADSSVLTHGAGKILFCGNPVKALRARREKLRTAPCVSTFTPRNLTIHVPEHMYDPEDRDGKQSSDVFAELRAWRDKHSRRLEEIQNDRLPQVLVVQHGNEDDDDDCDDEGEGFDSVSSDDTIDTSTDSSFKPISTDHLKPTRHDADHLSSSSDITHCPRPPPKLLNSKPATGNKRPTGIRAQRIRINQADSVHILHPSDEGHNIVKVTTTARTDLPTKSIQQVTRMKKLQPLSPARIAHTCKISGL